MRTHVWDPKKNEWLKKYRNISFEEIIFLIEGNCLIDIVQHPNKRKYPDQKFYVVDVRGYAYLVPYVQAGKEIFLKTIIPSRKATRKYLKGGH